MILNLRWRKMKKNSKYISNTLSLRKPQKDSLEVFENICDVLKLEKEVDLEEELKKVQQIIPTLESFERGFPSVCFALATGVGKTRLMGALIAYLHYEKGINNFFIMAPDITIYDKLKADFANPDNPKYVFKGLDRFVQPPRIIEGENYKTIRQGTSEVTTNKDVTINIFNISKLNKDSRGEKGNPPKIKEFIEELGMSYFDYLKGLDDLCIFMDESHRYYADASFNVINDLEPILGVEMTATPLKPKRSKKVPFENVVYKYSLAEALADKQYVKIPTVLTRENFNPKQYTNEELDRIKLKDGVIHHRQTKISLIEYSKNYDKVEVKPFILIVAKDTKHAKEVKEYICSDEFFKGYYKDKVIEIHSKQGESEKEENIKKLVALETPTNKIEIVIHVNKLKEGWDVNNLYTIIPLRTSASDILTEQTMGRGLRLPYGQRTGVFEVDSLTIIGHDNYERIIEQANKESSIFRAEHLAIRYAKNTDVDLHEVEQTPSRLYMEFNKGCIQDVKGYLMSEDDNLTDQLAEEMAMYVGEKTKEVIMKKDDNVKTYDDLSKEEVRKKHQEKINEEVRQKYSEREIKVETLNQLTEKMYSDYVSHLTDFTIAIPQGTVQANAVVKQVIKPFKLNVKKINWEPTKGGFTVQELQKGGKRHRKSISQNLSDNTQHIANEIEEKKNAIVSELLRYENIDYEQCVTIIQSLMIQLQDHLHSYLNNEEVLNILTSRKEELAEEIYNQMNANFDTEQTIYTVDNMRGFSEIKNSATNTNFKNYTDSDFNKNDIKKYTFTGFKKGCHDRYKFDSDTERMFSVILESDDDVLKWMCPSVKQFDIYYEKHSTQKYEPDFIVETDDMIYMIETKARKDEHNDMVIKKAKAGVKYCEKASEFNIKHGQKQWQYGILFDDEIKPNSTFDYLVKNMKKDF